MRSTPTWAAGGLLLAAACAEGSSGALGQTEIRTHCAPGDAVCLASSVAPLARGATLSLDVTTLLAGSSALDLRLEAVDPEILQVRGTAVAGRAEGSSALLILNADDLVIDFIHLWVAEPSGLALHRLTDDGEELDELRGRVQLLPGETFGLSASLRRGQKALSGEAQIQWELDPAVAVLLEDGVAGHRRLLARGPGNTVLRARAAGMISELSLEVLP